MSMIITQEYRPILSRHVKIRENHDGLTIKQGGRMFMFSSTDKEILLKIYPYLNGKYTISDIVSRFDLNNSDVSELISELSSTNVIFLAPTKRSMSGIDFANEFKKCSMHWKEEIFCGRLWESLLNEFTNKNLLFGFLIETFHYVESAKEYMPLALAHCQNYDLLLLLGKHFAEEREHGGMFLDACEIAGLDANEVKHSLPLPTTRSLINFLREIAVRDTLNYLVAQSIFQSTADPNDRTNVENFYSHLERSYNIPKGVFDCFRKHSLIDYEQGHEHLFHKAFEKIQAIDSEKVKELWNTGWALVENLCLFYDGIYRYYSNDDVEIPRSRIDIFRE